MAPASQSTEPNLWRKSIRDRAFDFSQPTQVLAGPTLSFDEFCLLAGYGADPPFAPVQQTIRTSS